MSVWKRVAEVTKKGSSLSKPLTREGKEGGPRKRGVGLRANYLHQECSKSCATGLAQPAVTRTMLYGRARQYLQSLISLSLSLAACGGRLFLAQARR